MRDDRQIDGCQHGLTRAIVDRIRAEQDLLAALRHDAKTKVEDAVQGLGGRFAAVQGQGRDGGVVVAVGLGNLRDGPSQAARRRPLARV